jgi:hypothetical protein
VGVGWSLSGLSQISRCKPTLSTEGTVRGVHYTDATTTAAAYRDRYCLDGKKLVQVNASQSNPYADHPAAYGDAGSEYRTEEDSYARITATPAAAGVAQAANELMFTVETKDGRTLTYTALYGTQYVNGLNQSYPTMSPAQTNATYGAHSANARFTGLGAHTVVSWALTKEQDASGNAIQYSYCSVAQAPYCSGIASNPANPVPSAVPSYPQLPYPQMNQWLLSSIVYTIAADGSDTSGLRRSRCMRPIPRA